MPIGQGILRIHQVTPLQQDVQKGRAGGVQRHYLPVTLPGWPKSGNNCRVTPQSSEDRTQQMEHAADIDHIVEFDFDPQLDERFRIQWNGVGNNTVLRLLGLPVNVCGLSRIWRVKAVARVEDNLTPATEVE